MDVQKSGSFRILLNRIHVECSPRCGACRCGKCAIGAKGYTLKEERELALIENNLVEDHLEVKYPWIKDPYRLPKHQYVCCVHLLSFVKMCAVCISSFLLKCMLCAPLLSC